MVVPGRREAGAALWRGPHGRGAGGAASPVPRALGVLPGRRTAATQLPHATGIAWAMKMQAKATGRRGQGGARLPRREATSAEDFHAGLNFAGVFRVPAVFVCINGVPAEPASVETVSETIAVKALAYGHGRRARRRQRPVRGLRGDAGGGRARPRGRRRDADRGGAGGDGRSARPAPAWLANQKILDAAAEAALRSEVEAEADAAFAAQ